VAALICWGLLELDPRLFDGDKRDEVQGAIRRPWVDGEEEGGGLVGVAYLLNEQCMSELVFKPLSSGTPQRSRSGATRRSPEILNRERRSGQWSGRTSPRSKSLIFDAAERGTMGPLPLGGKKSSLHFPLDARRVPTAARLCEADED